MTQPRTTPAAAGHGPAGRRNGRLGRLLPSGTTSAARTPFVLLIVVLLASGLIGLLVLNSAVNQGSFQLSRLEKETRQLTDEEQALQQEVDEHSDPGALAERARELGMVPGGNPAFLTPEGDVKGVPGHSASASPAAALSTFVPRPPSAAPSPRTGAPAAQPVTAGPAGPPSAAPSTAGPAPARAANAGPAPVPAPLPSER
ncbi:hypothetical protein GCM10027168_74960 [Streptomyces capparidis]